MNSREYVKEDAADIVSSRLAEATALADLIWAAGESDAGCLRDNTLADVGELLLDLLDDIEDALKRGE